MKYFLQDNVKAVPLIWQWYAWTHLVAPQTAACNLAERYIKIIESYLLAPQTHLKAAKNPRLIGGPFLNLEETYINSIENLLIRIRERASNLLELNTALKFLDKLLIERENGGSLEEIYKQVPENLKGMVELHYDSNNNPGYRLFEKITYQKYYDLSNQSVVISFVNEDFLPFCLSTPHIPSENEVVINLPFSHSSYDKLFRSRYEPTDIEELISELAIPDDKINLFRSFFTDKPKKQLLENLQLSKKDVRLRYFGHACILIESQNISILFAPVVSYNYHSDIARYTFSDLPDKIDYVVFTHNHQDHVLFETLLQIRHKVGSFIFSNNGGGNLLDPSIKRIFEAIGFFNLIALEDFEEINFLSGKVMALPSLGEHGDLNICSKAAYFVEINGKKIFLGADSNNLDEQLYYNIFKITGPMNVIFLGLECDGAPLTWIYGPLLSSHLDRKLDKERSLSGSDFKKVWSIVQAFSPKQVYIYAMVQETWLNHVIALNYHSESPQIIESNKLLKAC